ncbi:helix-turn-helix domain-containing protein [Pedobacter sp. UYP1]|jgi:transcriptional regulator GlxA family with amidase domain|uniref:GlxA family transcriptional regulator n=1 Tax=Pedobacter sp. UYP1 TaxID=1756396 RepID=UPI0033923A6F
MKQICFLLVGGKLKPSSLFGAIEVFEKANLFLQEKGRPPCYSIQLVGEEFGQPMLNSFFSLRSLKHTSEVKKTDCIIIPAFEPEENAKTSYAEALTWLVDQYKNGAEVASLCSGAFLLAACGLLDGKPCSTHWRAEAVFKRMFPKTLLATDKIITDHQGIYTSGGAMSAFNLCLYLVEKHNGREAALFCTKLMQLDIERHSQSPFQIFTGLKKHADEIIRDIQDFIEMNTSEKITVDFLAAKCNMDRVNFSRRFKKATQLPPVDYIQQVKIEAAKRALETGSQNINEIMYSVGYIDAKAFRTIFKKVTGLSPTEYKSKFSH